LSSTRGQLLVQFLSLDKEKKRRRRRKKKEEVIVIL